MAQEKIGEVQTPSGSTYYIFWDQTSGDIHVGSEYAGNALSQSEAMRQANYYATTTQIIK
ncbi:hypothetical protein [Calothrix sp. UHCC 0171]|uniref:hypothetical protein n=1 Tax=Calothrix sp. UHCC 0171 TaxID=3110245 RepID=UPI002B1FEAFE|nr:hypothetical protein [Calothrix sp. UHCC 0171]MEA5572749.1 hypothetical protein [Calothrix sp. UHCC 0171]